MKHLPLVKPSAYLLATTIFLALALVSPATLLAQDDDAQMSEFFEAIEVNVVNVEVFVTDKKGEPIVGLTQDDFRVFEDGEEQEITNFFAGEEVRATVGADGRALPLEGGDAGSESEEEISPDQRLHLIVFIDNRNISPGSRNRVLEAVKQSMFTDLDPRDRVTLVAYSGGLTVRRYPTADVDALVQGIDELATGSPIGQQRVLDKMSLLRQMNQFDLEEATRPAATGGIAGGGFGSEGGPDTAGVRDELLAYAQREYEEVRATIASLSKFVSVLSGLPGRKALIYVSDGLSLRPGEALMESFDRANSAAGANSAPFNAAVESRRFDVTSYFEDLGRQANSGRVTFYTILAKGRSSSVSGAERSAFFSMEADAATLGQTWDQALETIEYSNYRGSMEILAQATGGQATLAALDFDQAIKNLKQDFDAYYSIGYRSPHDDEKDHKIKVELSNPDWRVRHRETQRRRSADELMAAETRSTLMLAEGENPLGVRVEFGEAQQHEKKQWLVPVIVKFPIAKLVLLPGESFHEGKVAIYVGAQSPDGDMSPIQKLPAPVRVPNDQLLTAMSQVAGYQLTLLMRPGEHRVAVTVRDELADVSSVTLVSHTPDVSEAAAAADEHVDQQVGAP